MNHGLEMCVFLLRSRTEAAGTSQQREYLPMEKKGSNNH